MSYEVIDLINEAEETLRDTKICLNLKRDEKARVSAKRLQTLVATLNKELSAIAGK